MFEQDMERLEHEIDDALLFYYAAQDEAEKETCIIRAVEACLERLQCCRSALRDASKPEDLQKSVQHYLSVTDCALQEGISKFWRNTEREESNYWRTLTRMYLSLNDDLCAFCFSDASA